VRPWKTAATSGALLLALAVLAGAAAGEECGGGWAGPGTARVESERVVLVFRTEPARIVVGQHFSLEAVVCARRAESAPTGLRLDAHMPDHRHGMNYRAVVVPRGNGRYVAEGLLFHMPGRWQLVFDVASGAGTERLVRDVVLE
jgi:hypothetical protein